MRELLDARDTVRSPAADAELRAVARERLAAYANDAAARCDKLRKQLKQADGLADDLRREAAA
jgi:hypothetical protein